jgi:hypothetical protein
VLLVDVTGSRSVEVHLVGFEFDRESSWLEVAGQITDGSACWSWQEACLTLDEAEWLGEWLIVAAGGRPADVEMLFTEQDLSVSFVAATPEAVTLDWCVPHSAGAKNRGSDLRITTTRHELLNAVRDWRSALAALPDR